MKAKTTKKKSVTKKSTVKKASMKAPVKKIVAKKVAPKVAVTKKSVHKEISKAEICESKICGLFSTGECKDLVMTIIKIIIFGAIISLAFTYGSPLHGAAVVGAIVTAYAGCRHMMCGMEHKEDKHKREHKGWPCIKSIFISGVIGGFSAWILAFIGEAIADTTGFVLGIIIGITIAIRISAKVTDKSK